MNERYANASSDATQREDTTPVALSTSHWAGYDQRWIETASGVGASVTVSAPRFPCVRTRNLIRSSQAMRLLRLVLLASALVLPALASQVGCKQDGSRAAAPGKRKRLPPSMPKPLPLPKSPPMAAHIAEPNELARTIDTYVPDPVTTKRLASEILRGLGLPQLEAEVAAGADGRRPWAAARVSEQNLLYLPLRKPAVAAVKTILDGYPKEGKFGAVRLPTPENAAHASSKEGTRVAWLNEPDSSFTIAGDLRGIATGQQLLAAYGDDPLFFTLEQAGAEKIGVALPAERVTLRGAGTHEFELVAQGISDDGIKVLDELDNGALTGMLEAPQVAVGASTRWAEHAEAVHTIISRVTRQVKEQNFLIRGVLEDLVKRLNATLRAWNGRVMVGVGPSNHVLLSLGSDDVAKAERAVLHLLSGVTSNLKTAKSFGLPVPSISLRKSQETSADTNVHLVTVAKLGNAMPPAIQPLLDEKTRLRVAMAFSKRAGGGMVVVGPEATKELSRWLADSAKATPAADSEEDLLAATIAVKPDTLRPAIEQPDGLGVLKLTADRKPTRLLLRRKERDLVLTVKGPKLAPPTLKAIKTVPVKKN